MIDKIHHIGIAVEDLDAAVELYRSKLGLSLLSRETLVEPALEIATFALGESQVELIASCRPGTPIEKFLKRRGPGIHHVAYQVENIEIALETCESTGLSAVDGRPKVGAGGTRTVFLHPKTAMGVLIELVEANHDQDDEGLST